MAVYDGTQGSKEGYDIFDTWSRRIPGYDDQGIAPEKWASLDPLTAEIGSLLVRYLSKPSRKAGPPVSTIFLASHLSIFLRRHPEFSNISRHRIHKLTCQLARTQLCLFL